MLWWLWITAYFVLFWTVFGFLLAAIAVQLMLDGLQSVGAIQLSAH